MPEASELSKIRFVEVKIPALFCKNNVEVIDTPGTNDLTTGRVEITYDYLKKADAVILLLSAEQALSKSEKEFISEWVTCNPTKDFFIVISHKDYLEGPKQENEVKQYVLFHLSDLGDFSKRVFVVSSRQALLYRRKEAGELLPPRVLRDLPNTIEETGFPKFERELLRFISSKRSGR